MLLHQESWIHVSAVVMSGLFLPLGVSALVAGETPVGRRDPARAAMAALFRADGFPTVDAPVLEAARLDQALAGLPVETLTSPLALGQALRLDRFDVLILPYGSAFPVDAWPAIRAFVRGGGGLVVLG
ncbi:MAG: hypothetical protein ACHQNV_11755, partial [Vicinamibacteria bacterium]